MLIRLLFDLDNEHDAQDYGEVPNRIIRYQFEINILLQVFYLKLVERKFVHAGGDGSTLR